MTHATEAPGLPFELEGNHIYLTAMVAGRPLLMILESGAGMTMLDVGAAERLGLQTSGAIAGAGAGASEVTVKLAGIPSLAVGGVSVPRMQVSVGALDALQRQTGRRFDGLLGYDVLSRFVVELDYARGRVTFHDPATFRYDGAGEVLPFRLEMNLIHIPATIVPENGAPIAGEFVLDTGCGGQVAVALAAPFARGHGLPTPSQRVMYAGSAGRGIGGASRADIGRLAELRLGPIKLASPVALFSRDTSGFFSWSGRAGVIGTEVLRRFRVFLDYPGRRIALEPNGHATEPFEWDMSGLALTADGDSFGAFQVTNVIPGTPAAEAGLEVGDVVERVNGAPAREMPLAGLRGLLLKPETRVGLTVRRGFERLTLALTTRRLL
jgi:hypothetical protein